MTTVHNQYVVFPTEVASEYKISCGLEFVNGTQNSSLQDIWIKRSPIVAEKLYK